MTKSLITPDLTDSFFDDSNTSLTAAWPFRIHQRFLVDLPEASVSSTLSRRMMPEAPDEKDKASSSVPVKTKKNVTPSATDNRGAPKKKPPTKKVEPITPAPKFKKPSPEDTPGKKSRDDSVKIKKNLPIPDTPPGGLQPKNKRAPDSSTPELKPAKSPGPFIKADKKPFDDTKPVKKDFPRAGGDADNDPSVPVGIIPKSKDNEPEPDPPGSDEVPPVPPSVDTDSVPPEPLPEPPDDDDPVDVGNRTVPEREFAEERSPDTPIADLKPSETEPLTDEAADDSIDEQMDTNTSKGFFSAIGQFFDDLMDYVFPEKAAVEDEVPNYVPVNLPPPRNPKVEIDPAVSFRAGYISQRDLEVALGREDWTMCCATTFVYAVQSKYPGLGREDILSAAQKAADTELADESGNCVEEDGYIPSLYQYSQALSANLGLKDYVDISGQYSSVESARAAGAEIMKVELSGRLNDKEQEHHILQIGANKIDPASRQGIETFWENESSDVENVMALGWYSIP